ncbi:MAG: CPBP family intramembrane metalloprotease [Edaphobacter sp.]|uniref:CPBP family intramembrane glutamic endopeptidase n=1 Tax=Edaphobacter sp. TaxID=1934404 RepID=UPI00239340DA|nr:CPBP family intramembrane glutamic endopeptidase [Edaphobacter sp.]MDE1176212.1 CPBP family intramembrane metalloprotease [Edaphobacter sp.]
MFTDPTGGDNSTTPASSSILFGPYGLRAGWGLLLAAVFFFILYAALSSLLHHSHLIGSHLAHTAPDPHQVLLVELVGLLAIAVTTWIMALIEKRSIGLFGLGGSDKLKHLISGLVAGLVAITLLVLVLLKAGLLIIDQHLLAGATAFRYALLWIPGFLAIGFFEEYLFRGYLQYTLARSVAALARSLSVNLNANAVGFWAAAVLVSFGFGAVHGSNPGESPFGLVCAGFASLLFCFSLWRTGSLWWAIGMHAAWDYGQSFLFGVADSGTMIGHRLLATHPVGAPLFSGGATGPEGSILCLPVLLLLAVVVHFTQPAGEKGYSAHMPVPKPTNEDTAAP